MGRNEKITALQQQLTDGVAAIATSDQWQAMLDTAARFHSYSANNVILIMLQRPDATRVAGYRTWQSLGRQVRKGEKGLSILTPRTGPCWDCRGEGTLDGYACSKCGGAGRVLYFKTGHVFDVAQTEGDELPEVAPELLTGDDRAGPIPALTAQIEAAGYRVTRDRIDAWGRSVAATRTVTVHQDLADEQAAQVLLHELAHTRLGHPDDLTDYEMHRGIREVEAESIAYIAATALGMDASQFSFPYVARWSEGDTDVVKATADTAITTARAILADLDTAETRDEELVAA